MDELTRTRLHSVKMALREGLDGRPEIVVDDWSDYELATVCVTVEMTDLPDEYLREFMNELVRRWNERGPS